MRNPAPGKRISWLIKIFPNRLSKPVAWDFVTDKQNFKKTYIARYVKKFRKLHFNGNEIEKKKQKKQQQTNRFSIYT